MHETLKNMGMLVPNAIVRKGKAPGQLLSINILHPLIRFLPIVGRARALGNHKPDIEFIVQSLAHEAQFVFGHHEAFRQHSS